MSFEQPIRFFREGVGNINYQSPFVDTGDFIAAADDGLTVESVLGVPTVRLGQAFIGGSGADLLEDRRIPLNGHTLFLTDGNGTTGFLSGLMGITGNSSSGPTPEIDLIDGFSGNSLIITVETPGVFLSTPASALSWASATNYWSFLSLVSAPAFAPAIRTSVGTPVVSEQDTTIVVDTSGGNAVVTINPALNTRIMNIKKKGTDLNTITIQPSTGSIYADSGAQASFVFSGAGESISVQSDLTDLFVL